MEIQPYGGTYDPETNKLILKFRDVSMDPMDWQQKCLIEVEIPAELVTYTDLLAPTPNPLEGDSEVPELPPTEPELETNP